MNKALLWFVFTIVFTIISFIKQKIFLKYDKSFNKDNKTILKTRTKHIKTIDEQKKYIRAKSNLGKDFVTMVFSIFTFYVAFIWLIYPHITTFNIGIIVVLIYSAVFSAIYAKLLIGKNMLYHIINSFINYLYTGSFLLFIKFVYHGPSLLLLLASILLMIGISYLLEKIW